MLYKHKHSCSKLSVLHDYKTVCKPSTDHSSTRPRETVNGNAVELHASHQYGGIGHVVQQKREAAEAAAQL